MATTFALWHGADGDNAFLTSANWDSTFGGTTGIVGTATVCIFPAMTAATSVDVAGGDYSSGGGTAVTALTRIRVESACYASFGSRALPLQFDSLFDTLEYHGEGRAFWGLSSTTLIDIEHAPTSSGGFTFGVNVTGATNNVNNALLIMNPGADARVGICGLETDAGIFASTTIRSGHVTVGSGYVGTGIAVSGGDTYYHSVSTVLTSLTITAGTFRYMGSACSTGLIIAMNGGTLYWNSPDNPKQITLENNATLSFAEDGRAKDFTAGTPCIVNLNGGSIYDPGQVATLASHININVPGSLRVI